MSSLRVKRTFRNRNMSRWEVRPVCADTSDRVRARLFLCARAFSVERQRRYRLSAIPLEIHDQGIDEEVGGQPTDRSRHCMIAENPEWPR